MTCCKHTHTHTHTHHLQSYHHQHEVEEEPEPEWMEFGPTDRFDVIELKGFDKNELKREGMVITATNNYLLQHKTVAIVHL